MSRCLDVLLRTTRPTMYATTIAVYPALIDASSSRQHSWYRGWIAVRPARPIPKDVRPGFRDALAISEPLRVRRI